MFWVLYMMFSIFRSHRNQFYWRNGKLHFTKQSLRQQQQQHQIPLTALQEERLFRQNIRQWFIFYSVLTCIIISILIHRLYSRQKSSV
ncbi:unnamed protein product [Rotaria sordida]|uniref:Uncharacterized protein n=1 Tax=Rotaria sordida TaxID=392033 RepID=A0A818YI84_9BILA|nr:unnamed protein product [Rotaria sordida]CAF0775641.1 unnamed protein product [Rotaria sordida]CAF0777959.1 unnamed protein product [Rotaria sordida]CAF0810034.1 unnamed protein product [Rotaria sordida]CAF0813754.1 unnamed protein product [Rotaria sordida]